MYGFIEKDSDLKIEDAVYDKVLNAGLGWMHELKKGQTFRILDIADMTVEGSIAMGAAIAATAIVNGMNPFAATVLALTHVNALKIMSENTAPGEKPKFEGILYEFI